MKDKIQNLLSGKVFEGVALTQKLFNIKPKVPRRFKRLTNTLSRVTFVAILMIFLSGYYPTLTFPPVKQATILAGENIQKDEILASSFPQPVILPHPGYLSNKFSKFHPGVDIATGLDMPVHPITSGIVTEVNFGFFGYGNHVIISHSGGFKSLYGHLGRIYAKNGQEVTSENILGEVGLSGFTSGPHTHLEITKDDNYINPLTILPEISDMPASQRGEPKENLAKK